MIEKINETKFVLEFFTIYKGIVARHIKIGIETGQEWDDIGNKSDKYMKNIFNKYLNLIKSCKDLKIINEIIIQEKFPELDSMPEDFDFVYYLGFYYQLFKIKVISVVDIAARLILAINDLNYNFHKINLKNFNKEPLLRNTDTLLAYRAFWNDFYDLRTVIRNIIVHEGEYKSKIIERIDELIIEPDSILSDSEYLKDWFNSKKQENLERLKSEVTKETEIVFQHLIKIMDTLFDPMKSKFEKLK